MQFLYLSVAWGGVVVNEVKEILGGGDLVVVGDFPWVIGILDISLGEEVRKNMHISMHHI
jgi:hypothetical protein